MNPHWRQVVVVAGILSVALTSHLLFAGTSEGLITPEGSVSTGTAVLGILAIGSRLLALFGIPAFISFLIGTSLVDWARTRRRFCLAGRPGEALAKKP